MTSYEVKPKEVTEMTNGKQASYGDYTATSFAGTIKCRSPRTRCEKGLLFLTIVFILLVTGLIIALVLLSFPDEDSDEKVCDTPNCARAAARLLDSIDRSVDPCEDFYTYACGQWKRRNIIPEDKSGQNVFGILADEVKIINKYLLEDTKKYKDVEGIQKAKDMYASCVDEDRIEEKNISVVFPLLDELGGWPVLGASQGGNWNESTFDLSDIIVTLRRYNNRPIVSIFVGTDVKDNEKRIIYIDQSGFGLPGRLYYTQESLQHMRDAYVNLAKSTAVLLGADPTVAKADMERMLDLETELSNITMKPEERRDNELLYNKMTVGDLAKNITEPGPNDTIQFSWERFVLDVMKMEGVNITINASEPIVVRAVPYFRKVFGVLQKYDKRTIANYAVWIIMKNRIFNLPSQFRTIIKEYNTVVFGQTTQRARWKDCESYTIGILGMAVGHMFVKETFDESAKTTALEMIKNIKVAFNELLDETDWMDEPTKALAREKAAAIREWIGYADDILDVDAVNKLYANITYSRQEYFENVLSNLRWVSASGLNVLREKHDRNVWSTPPSTVNAFYNSILNNIMFPAGILQPPMYSKDQPQAMNYGCIGVIIGHEITHGFDDRGRQYDKDGNLVQWWDDTVVDRFKTKAQCMIDQYSAFVVPEANMSLNGINTQGENIADNGGLKQSYRAYRQWVRKQGHEEPRLPGLNFTSNQLFFLGFAQTWCNNMRAEAAIGSVNTGHHSPGQFRVIGPLQNSPDFARAFNCPKNSYMNPEKKCAVW